MEHSDHQGPDRQGESVSEPPSLRHGPVARIIWRPLKFTVLRISRFYARLHPAKLTVLGYLSYIMFGWLLLSLPFAQSGQGVKSIDNLFNATSAVSTTGLVTVSVSDSYTLFGQIVILLLIQLGGIGYMTLGSFIILSRSSELSGSRDGVARVVFSLPSPFRIDKFVRSVIVFTIVIETVGALALYPVFRDARVATPAWSAVFHSISAFCTAGFGLYNNSFEGFAGNFWLNAVISALSLLGAMGFILTVDFWRLITGKVRVLTLTSKVILWSTFWLIVAGTSLIFLTEPSIQAKPADERLLASFFQAMTASTTVGFNTINIAEVSKATLLVLTILMVIGASPSGTGGGLKSTTFSAVVGVMMSALRGEQQVRFWGRPVPAGRLELAVASFTFYVMMLVLGVYLLELSEKGFLFEQNLFEAASALGTIGLSTGITANLSNLGKIIVIALMFCGRLGPMTFGIALFQGRTAPAPSVQDSDLAV